MEDKKKKLRIVHKQELTTNQRIENLFEQLELILEDVYYSTEEESIDLMNAFIKVREASIYWEKYCE